MTFFGLNMTLPLTVLLRAAEGAVIVVVGYLVLWVVVRRFLE